jgi:hypothetical protein
MRDLLELVKMLSSSDPLKFENLKINEIVYLSVLKCMLVCVYEMPNFINVLSPEELSKLMDGGISNMTMTLMNKISKNVEFDFQEQFEEEFKKHFNGYLN